MCLPGSVNIKSMHRVKKNQSYPLCNVFADKTVTCNRACNRVNSESVGRAEHRATTDTLEDLAPRFLLGFR
jgi:hypothetical protein